MKITLREFDQTIRAIGEVVKVMINDIKGIQCKYCSSPKVVKFGTYHGIQRYYCKTCKRKFTLTDALPKMKTPIPQIASALDCYYGGMSLNAAKRHLEQQYGNPITNAGIYNWVIRFSKDIGELAKDYKPNVGDVWVADETVLKIGGQNVWFWDILDAKTRFLLASHMSLKRTTADALKLMKQAEARAGKIPKIVFTDKLRAYTDGIELAWGADAKHIPSKGFVKPMNTNLIERFHGILKDRTRVMRGMKKIETAKLLLDGWLVYYNYLRPHESLKNITPAEKAGIKFPFKNWMDVVRSKQDKVVIADDGIVKSFSIKAHLIPVKTRTRLVTRKQVRKPHHRKQRSSATSASMIRR